MTDPSNETLKEPQLHVVRVLNDRELIVSGGASAGLQEEDVLTILDAPSQIVDPITNDVLGEFVATKGLVQIYQLADKFALARTFRNKRVKVNEGGIADVFNPPKYELRKESLTDAVLGEDGKERLVKPGDAVRVWDGPVEDAPTFNAST